MAKSAKRPTAVFSLKKLGRIGDFILAVRTIALNILNNAGIFVGPVPTPAALKTSADVLETANVLAKTRVTGSASARDLKYDLTLDDIHAAQMYVQGLADKEDEPTAISIIQASGFELRNHGVRVKPDLAVKQGNVSGTAIITAKSAGKRVSYLWQQSVDGVVWTDLPATLQAKTTVTDLTPLQSYYFRFRPVLKDGLKDWSPMVSIIVM